MGYYGVILNVGNLGGDFYFNLFLVMVVEYPAKLISISLMDRIGRKRLYIAYMLVGGIACAFTIYPVLKKTESRLEIIIFNLLLLKANRNVLILMDRYNSGKSSLSC